MGKIPGCLSKFKPKTSAASLKLLRNCSAYWSGFPPNESNLKGKLLILTFCCVIGGNLVGNGGKSV